MAREEIVSNESEQLILVDDLDREIGFRAKTDAHTGKGVLHRAFSIFVFNSDNELLLQQRSPTKFGAVGAEHELCSVYFGRYDGPVDVNVTEIAAWRFVGVEALERELKVAPETFTPWFKMEWVHIKANYLDGMLASTGTDG